ncbi:sigma-54 dependent transcriptional regulator [bacterium]|nr:sigma-54 dependent transcriptional regulator [bacterium]
MPAVLVVEDNRTLCDALAITLTKMGLTAEAVESGDRALECLRHKRYDLVITDFKLPGANGLEVLETAKKLQPGADVILITAFGSVELAVEAMKLGAVDFMTKGFTPEEFRLRVQKALAARADAAERSRLAEENERLRADLEEAAGLGQIVGESSAMREVFETLERVAATDASVLITGESGTGKELAAREIHFKSPRRDKPFVKVACGALSESLLESELFGHEKGAFTGSVKSRKGRFELAHGGTIFLDEIGDISATVQVKLLRVLQEREFERVGGEKTLAVDVRLVSATNKDLKAEVREGRFREDLFFRLHVVPLHMPALREREGDIPLLARNLAAKVCRRMNRPTMPIGRDALEALSVYAWPGNVRELENVIERAIVLCRGESLTAVDLPPLAESGLDLRLPAAGSLDLTATLEDIERRIIGQAFRRNGGNKTQTARCLGINTSTLYYKLEKYGLIEPGGN